MDDIIALVLLASVLVVMAILLWMRGSLQKAVGEMSLQVRAASAPAQALGPVVAGVNQAVTSLGSGIKEISVQAEKIATLGQKYEETEKYTKDIYSVLVGSYSKGKAGEEALRRSMIHLVKTGQVKAKQPLGGGEVEYAIVFRDGKMMAIDSKVVTTEEVSGLSESNLSEDDRSKMVSKIKSAVKQKIPEVQKYIQPPRTLPMAIMAVPDSIMETVSELIPQAMERNVILLGFSAVPQLIGYFMRIHESYTVEQDVAVLKEKISRVQQEISLLDDKFFSSHLEKPLGKLNGAFDKVRSVVFTIKNTLAFETGTRHEKTSSRDSVRDEEEIAVPAIS